jgi:hypothetical protein
MLHQHAKAKADILPDRFHDSSFPLTTPHDTDSAGPAFRKGIPAGSASEPPALYPWALRRSALLGGSEVWFRPAAKPKNRAFA